MLLKRIADKGSGFFTQSHSSADLGYGLCCLVEVP
jgi:hypothetical protein